MLSFSFYIFLMALYFLDMSNISCASLMPFTPTDDILLNCGSPSKTASNDGRGWDTDTPYISNTSTTSSTQSEPAPSVDQIPYSTARIFSSKFTYKFNVSEAGQKFLRLYFYPTNYSDGFDSTTSFFSVHAADHTLLSNFSAFLNLQPGSLTLVKEYIITVNQSRVLEVTFTPSPNSSAFVNAIEVVSIPEMLYIKGNDTSQNPITLAGLHAQETSSLYIDDSMALEKLYRLNVGGHYIPSTNDSGMFRSWDIDWPYLLGADVGLLPVTKTPTKYTNTTPPYTAPEDVYSTARTMQNYGYISNMTWFFPVDSGFYYLLRLYFCEMRHVTNSGQVVFDIFICNQTAEDGADIFDWTGGRGIPIYKDYAVFVSANQDGSKSKPDLWLTLRPNKAVSQFHNTILNGLEIFKLSSKSLASLNPEYNVPLPPSETKKPGGIQMSGASHSPLTGYCIGGSLGVIILFLFIVGLLLYIRKRQRTQDNSNKLTCTNISSLPSVRSQKFSLEEIKLATSNFDDNFVIGRGGFGNVYKGYLENGTCPVAIKRLNPSSRQGAHEFQTEIKMLSHLRHLHLVPLIGYCNDGGEMILVYEIYHLVIRLIKYN